METKEQIIKDMRTQLAAAGAKNVSDWTDEQIWEWTLNVAAALRNAVEIAARTAAQMANALDKLKVSEKN